MDGLDVVVSTFFLLGWFVYGIYRGIKKIKSSGTWSLSNLKKALAQEVEELDDSDLIIEYEQENITPPSPEHIKTESQETPLPIRKKTAPSDNYQRKASRPRNSLQKAIIWAEILGPPVSLRKVSLDSPRGDLHESVADPRG